MLSGMKSRRRSAVDRLAASAGGRRDRCVVAEPRRAGDLELLEVAVEPRGRRQAGLAEGLGDVLRPSARCRRSPAPGLPGRRRPGTRGRRSSARSPPRRPASRRRRPVGRPRRPSAGRRATGRRRAGPGLRERLASMEVPEGPDCGAVAVKPRLSAPPSRTVKGTPDPGIREPPVRRPSSTSMGRTSVRDGRADRPDSTAGPPTPRLTGPGTARKILLATRFRANSSS